MWEDESEAVAPIIWLYQTVDAQKEDVFFSDLLITLRRYASSYAKSNCSYSPETVKLGCDLCDFDLWSLTMTVRVGRVEKPFL